MTEDISRKTFFKLGAALAAAAATPAAAATKSAARPKSAARTLIRNVDVLTMQTDHAELPGMDVMLEKGRIAAIAKSIPAGDAEVIDGTARILMPGFTDAFRQTWQTLDLGRLPMMNQSVGVYNAHLAKMTATMTAEDRHLADYYGGIDAINSGFTALISLDRFGPSERSEASYLGLKESGIGGVFSHGIADPYNSILPGPAAFKAAEAFRDKHFRSGDDLHFGLTMNLKWGNTYEEFKAYFDAARRLTPKMMTMYHHVYGSPLGYAPSTPPPALPPGTIRAVADLRACGVLGPDLQINHANALTDEELKFLAAAGVTFGAAPLVEFDYPIEQTCIHGRAQAAGGVAGLALDVPFTVPRDPFELARAAYISLYRTPASRAIVENYASDDPLIWLTRNGAICARMGDQAGTITVGKRADVVLLNTDRISFPAVGSLADRVSSFAQLSDIDSVWVGGRARKRNGKMVGIDIAALKAKAVAHQERMWEAMGSPVYGIHH